MSGAVLEVRDLGVRYGRHTVMEGVSLAVEPGEVYALLGRNGEGKTSLIRCLLGWQAPSEGEARLFGEDAWSSRREAMQRIGMVEENPSLPPAWTVGEVLTFCGKLHRRWDSVKVAALIDQARVSVRQEVQSLSRGQKAQVALAMALGSGPDVLVLDDPTLGLDAVARRALYDALITTMADAPLTVLITGHDLAGLEAVTDRVGILAGGRLQVDEPLEALKGRLRRIRWSRPTAGNPDLGGLEVLRRSEGPMGGEALVGRFDEAVFASLEQAWGGGLQVESLSLEEAFIEWTAAEGEVRA
ncbi:MAG TPA: ABC transporter ATP-binding protein [Holophagaceae bacterium]|nr:ABC transporter ATP-binding protein [Holophagaceae bacterium]